jgi:hypothetical protein
VHLEFTPPFDERQGTISAMLQRRYADLPASDPLYWKAQQERWERYDHAVYCHRETIGASIFFI